MAKKRIYQLLNKAVLTVTDLFMIDKSGDENATYVSGQQIVDLVDSNLVTKNFANNDLTFTGNRTHNLDGYQLTLDGDGAVNFYVNQTADASVGIYSTSTTGYAGHFVGGDGTTVKIDSESIGLDCSGKLIGGLFSAAENNAVALEAIQDKGSYSLKTTGNINFADLPTDDTGLVSGDLWRDGGKLSIVP
jgi:hypothetical protein